MAVRVAGLTMLLSLAACPLFGGGGGAGPCSDDANGCGNGGALMVDSDCALDDVLELELGGGEGLFQSLAPGEAPDLLSGAQGGQHMVLGVGVDNPSPDHLAFEVMVSLAAGDGDETRSLGERAVVYEGSLVSFEAGRVELLDLVVIPQEWPEEGRRWISVSVMDACGRAGQLDHAID